MLHYCPLCQQHYECEPIPQPALPAMPFSHSLKCGNPYQCRCTECARRVAALMGEKLFTAIRFVYTNPAA